jgi:tetratricopeptide (TPR) repeat protein
MSCLRQRMKMPGMVRSEGWVRLLFTALLAACFPAGSSQTSGASASEAAMHRHYDAAYRLQAAGDIQGADREHQLFLSEALHRVANARANIGAYATAAPLFDEALRLDSANVDLQFDYAKAAMDAEDPQKAERLAEAALTQDAEMGTARKAWLLRIRGEALRNLGQQQLALEQFKAAAARDPSFENIYALGNAYLWVGDKADGTQVFAGMEQTFGDSAFLHMSLGRGYAEANYLPEAIVEFTKALDEDSHLRGAHYSLGASYLSLNGSAAYDKAEAEFRAELVLNPDDPFSYPQLGKIALDRQNYAEAERDLRRAIALNPDSPDNQLLLAQLDSETSHLPEAITALRKAIALTLDPSRDHYSIHAAHFQLGRLLIRTGQTAEGKKEMQIAEDLLARSDQQDANTLNGKPQVQLPLTTTRVPTAAEKTGELAYEKSVAPLLAGSYNNLGVHAAMADDYSGAAADFAHAQEWNPALAGIDSNWGRAAFAAHDFASAVAPLRRVLHAHPADQEARMELGLSLCFTRDYADAVDVLHSIGASLNANPSLAPVYADCAAKASGATAGEVAGPSANQ